jgi:hypothetical protein
MCRLNGAAGQGVLPAATQFPIERNALYDEAYSGGLGLRQRIGVSTLGVIGGLLVLLVVAAVACEDAEPNATVEPTLPGTLVEVTDVEVVYASRERQPPFLFLGDYDPLWGDLDTDAPIIDWLLRAIAGGTPVEIMEIDEERTWTPYSSLIMNLRFRNGTTWSVRTAIKCDFTSEGRKTNCLSVPDHWELLHRNEVVVSTALTEWFQRVREYMPSVEHYALPDQIRLGEPFAISGAGYLEGDRVELSIEFIDQSKLPLG